jgi:hypothetical protein
MDEEEPKKGVPFHPEKETKRPIVDVVTMFAPAIMWLLILFRRPHKVK